VPTTVTARPVTPTSTNTTAAVPVPGSGPAAQPASNSSSSGVSLTLLLWILVPLLVIGLVAAYIVAVPRLKRRRAQRVRTSADTRDAVRAAWSTTLRHLDASGIPARATSTPLEIASSVTAHGAGPLHEPMVDLAASYGVAMYSPEPPTEDDAAAAWEYTDEIESLLQAEETAAQRWRRELDPRPLIRR